MSIDLIAGIIITVVIVVAVTVIFFLVKEENKSPSFGEIIDGE